MALRWKISHPRLCARLVLSRAPPHHDPPWVTEKFAGPYPGEEEEGKRGLSLPAPVKRKPPHLHFPSVCAPLPLRREDVE